MCADEGGAKAQVRQHLDDLSREVLAADRARVIYDTISSYADRLNRHAFADAMAFLQGTSLTTYVLELTKLFEPRHQRYEIISVATALDLIRENRESLEIVERPYTVRLLRQFEPTLTLSGSASSLEITDAFVTSTGNRLPRADGGDHELSLTLKALKTLRDKQLAHPERIDPGALPQTTWAETESLLGFVKRFLGIAGWAYLSLAYEFEGGDYVLSRDAQRSGRSLARLFDRAHLDESPYGTNS